MFENLLTPSVQNFIREHENADINKLLLTTKSVEGIPASTIASQINGRRKSKEKIPSYYSCPSVVYPAAVNLEQSSSEATARFKNDFLNAGVGSISSLADLTGGFGVDSFFFSRNVPAVTYVERDKTLFEIASHNHKALGVENIEHVSGSAQAFLADNRTPYEVMFIDPSRRVETRKVFSFNESEPNVIELKSKIFDRSKWLLVKASPMMDIKEGIRELESVSSLAVVAFDDEVKEILFLCHRYEKAHPKIFAVNLGKAVIDTLTFTFAEEDNADILLHDPQTFLYEPNAAILKAGAFKTVAKKFGLAKISVNTHYYTSEYFISDFPGRAFKIEQYAKPDRSTAALFPHGQANITTRNYPLSVDEIKKRTRLKDGGDKFLIGFSGQTKKFLVVASRLK